MADILQHNPLIQNNSSMATILPIRMKKTLKWVNVKDGKLGIGHFKEPNEPAPPVHSLDLNIIFSANSSLVSNTETQG